jgi:Rad3-related DNA helicase
MLDQLHKLLLTSGTLEPAGDFATLGVKPWKFSCGHVVSKDNFTTLCVSDGFDFRFDKRSDVK